MWKSFLDYLNLYGGLVGLISLFFSIFISITTGNIKRSIIQKRQFNEYKREKKTSIKNIKEVVASIDSDQIYDNRSKSELLIEINKLLKYKGFIDLYSRYYVFRLNQILKSDCITSKNVHKIVSYTSKLCGRMSVDPVNKEVG